MQQLNFDQMTKLSGGVEDTGIHCNLESRTEFNGIRMSVWACDNGTRNTNFSMKDENGMWVPFVTVAN